MALVNTKEMFKKAYDGGYAIGAFNINDMEIIQGIMSACAELKAPVILQVSSLSLIHIYWRCSPCSFSAWCCSFRSGRGKS